MKGEEKKNIVICGYPKSGTVWCTRLVGELLNCPVIGYWQKPDTISYTEGLDRVSDFACFQSHHLYHELNQGATKDDKKIIYIIRDPRDILVSGALHFRFYHPLLLSILKGFKSPSTISKYLKSLDYQLLTRNYKFKRMKQMMTHGDSEIPHCQHSWKAHISSYLGKEDVLIVRYEDLLERGPETCLDILSYCNIQRTEEEIREAIEKQSFASKKAEIEKTGPELYAKHLRKGVVGDWKNHLTHSDQRDLQVITDGLMEELGYQ